MVEKLGRKAFARACDVAQRPAVAELAEAATSLLGGVDLLINNAGVATSGPVDAIPQQDWEWIMGVNLWGVIYGCELFVPQMRAQGRGHVINASPRRRASCARRRWRPTT